MMKFTILRLLCVAVVVLSATATIITAELPGATSHGDDPHKGHTTIRDGMSHDDVRLAGHLAHYCLASVLRFPNMEVYRDKVADMNAGRKNFREVAEELNHFYMMKGETKQSSGEVGLITFNEVATPLAKLLFDIRNPEASEKAMNMLGPVQTDSGVLVGMAFKRYRKQFFSDAWWDLEQFARGSNMITSELLQLIENHDRLWQVSFMIWPQEHVSFKRLKIRQVKSDFKKIGGDDPSTQMPAPRKKMHPLLHKARIDERIDFFKKVDPKIIEAHPEIYAMSYEEIRAHGWHPELAAVQRMKDQYAEEARTISGEEIPVEQPADYNDRSKRAG